MPSKLVLHNELEIPSELAELLFKIFYSQKQVLHYRGGGYSGVGRYDKLMHEEIKKRNMLLDQFVQAVKDV